MKDIIDELREAFPDMWFKSGEEWDNDPDTAIIAWSGEDSHIGFLPAFDHYAYETDPSEQVYKMGVHLDLHNWCDKHGMYWECYDPGTYFLFSAG